MTHVARVSFVNGEWNLTVRGLSLKDGANLVRIVNACLAAIEAEGADASPAQPRESERAAPLPGMNQ